MQNKWFKTSFNFIAISALLGFSLVSADSPAPAPDKPNQTAIGSPSSGNGTDSKNLVGANSDFKQNVQATGMPAATVAMDNAIKAEYTGEAIAKLLDQALKAPVEKFTATRVSVKKFTLVYSLDGKGYTLEVMRSGDNRQIKMTFKQGGSATDIHGTGNVDIGVNGKAVAYKAIASRQMEEGQLHQQQLFQGAYNEGYKALETLLKDSKLGANMPSGGDSFATNTQFQ